MKSGRRIISNCAGLPLLERERERGGGGGERERVFRYSGGFGESLFRERKRRERVAPGLRTWETQSGSRSG